MIRVNLLRDRTASRTSAPSATGMTTDFQSTGVNFSVGETNTKAIVTNLIVLFIAPIALIYYEHYQIGILKAQAQAKDVALQTVQAELNQKKAKVAETPNLREKAQELTDKIAILNKLARLRLREVKSLDFIQTVIPDKVWLNEVNFTASNVEIKGNAVTDEDLEHFLGVLENPKYFSKVTLLSGREEKTQEGSVKAFDIVCNVEAD